MNDDCTHLKRTMQLNRQNNFSFPFISLLLFQDKLTPLYVKNNFYHPLLTNTVHMQLEVMQMFSSGLIIYLLALLVSLNIRACVRALVKFWCCLFNFLFSFIVYTTFNRKKVSILTRKINSIRNERLISLTLHNCVKSRIARHDSFFCCFPTFVVCVNVREISMYAVGGFISVCL